MGVRRSVRVFRETEKESKSESFPYRYSTVQCSIHSMNRKAYSHSSAADSARSEQCTAFKALDFPYFARIVSGRTTPASSTSIGPTSALNFDTISAGDLTSTKMQLRWYRRTCELRDRCEAKRICQIHFSTCVVRGVGPSCATSMHPLQTTLRTHLALVNSSIMSL